MISDGVDLDFHLGIWDFGQAFISLWVLAWVSILSGVARLGECRRLVGMLGIPPSVGILGTRLGVGIPWPSMAVDGVMVGDGINGIVQSL